MDVKPSWEHGYRCHGYWIGITQYGRVGLTPPGPWDTEYTASFNFPNGGYADRTFKELGPAKQWIEQLYEVWYEQ